MKRSVPSLVVCLCALSLLSGVAALAQAPPDFEAHWAGALQRLQAWPAEAERSDDSVVFSSGPGRSCRLRVQSLEGRHSVPPVLYLLDRDGAESFEGGSTHGWAALDTRPISPLGAPSPNPEQQPFHQAVLSAVRALDIVVSLCGGRARVGLVGEGAGASLALAVGALRPESVAFVCGHAPVNPAGWLSGQANREALPLVRQARKDYGRWEDEVVQAARYIDLRNFAPLLQAPVLLSYGEIDSLAPPETVSALYDEVTSRKELVPIARGRHCLEPDLAQFKKVWQQWMGATLNRE